MVGVQGTATFIIIKIMHKAVSQKKKAIFVGMGRRGPPPKTLLWHPSQFYPSSSPLLFLPPFEPLFFTHFLYSWGKYQQNSKWSKCNKDAQLGHEVSPLPTQFFTCQHVLLLPVGTERYTQFPAEAHLHCLHIFATITQQRQNNLKYFHGGAFKFYQTGSPKWQCPSTLQKKL